MIDFLIVLLRVIQQIFVLVVIANIILSYVMDPYHPIRTALGKIVEPFLGPIRRVLPTIGMFDFSPLVLIILVQLITGFIIGILVNVR
jgi:YggT family protein